MQEKKGAMFWHDTKRKREDHIQCKTSIKPFFLLLMLWHSQDSSSEGAQRNRKTIMKDIG